MNRRTFLKMLAASAAPAFIPAGRLWLPPERPTITVYRDPGSRGAWFYYGDCIWGTTKPDGIAEWTGRVPVFSSRPWTDVFLSDARAVGLSGDLFIT